MGIGEVIAIFWTMNVPPGLKGLMRLKVVLFSSPYSEILVVVAVTFVKSSEMERVCRPLASVVYFRMF